MLDTTTPSGVRSAEDAPAGFAQVAVLAQLGRAGGLFTYRVPPDLSKLVVPGVLVSVPFGPRQLQGIVVERTETCELPRVRDVQEVLDGTPALTAHQMRLAAWIAEYYHASLSDVFGAMLPPGLGRSTVYLLTPGNEPAGRRLTPEQQQVLDTVQAAGRIRQDELHSALDGLDVDRAVASLLRRDLLVRTAELAPPRVQAQVVRTVHLTDDGRQTLAAGQPARAPRRRAVLEALADHGPLASAALTELAPGAAGVLKILAERGWIAIEEQIVERSPLAGRDIVPTSPLPLSPAQAAALHALSAAIDRRRLAIFLLHGVTGSGKTEVYLQAIARVIGQGRQAVMMVPEISLTPQAVERVAGRFPGRVAVLHSKLSPGERLDEWQRIRRGEVDVVVGPRSALFAPLPNPGLIVVDEEHDPSYKQDAQPRYHGRDAAAVLGRVTGATVIFGSATPDVGTYHAARSGRIGLLELPDRPVWGEEGARPMPPVEVVDMRHELKAGNRNMFSGELLAAIEETLDREQQALIFLNRRGNATVVLCRDCGYVARCPNCDIPMTYHSAGSRLICHRCDRRTASPRQCPACHSPRIRYLGAGTQRVEEEVKRLFPRARVLRWDRDVTGGKDAHEKIVGQFSRHDADILVGTQMIAKGLDFPLVTLVGVISADTGLHLPDFRAPERSFQLLTQVAGRAGRAARAGRVIVQTYTPEHYAIQAARTHDYHRFFREEMSFRTAAGYPPLGRLIRFVYASEREESCRQSAVNLLAILQKACIEQDVPEVELIGPAPCFMARSHNRWFWQLIARAGPRPGSRGLHPLLEYVPPGWSVDVDPVDLL